jgi:hypothetical protein
VLFVCCVDQKVYKQLHSVSNQVKEAKIVSGDLRLTDGMLQLEAFGCSEEEIA